MKILFVAGTRPNFMKIAPLLRECTKYPNIETILVHTGQHYDFNMNDVFFNELKIKKPDLLLKSGEYFDPNEQKQYILNSIFDKYKDEDISAVIVVGDVNSTVGGAMAGSKLGVPVMHVEAGLRSFDNRMPEEHNRILVDELASIYFVTEPSCIKNLREKRFKLQDKQVFLVGNIMIDTLYNSINQINRLNTAKKHYLKQKDYVVLTLHRKENLEDINITKKLLGMLTLISKKRKIIWPMHPRAIKMLTDYGLYSKVALNSNIIIADQLGYFEMINLVKDSLCVVTDSGGIQDETTVLGVPCLTIRRTTERPITTTVGSSTIIGEDGAKLLRQFNRVLNGTYKKSRIPYLWDGHTSERIIKKLLEVIKSKIN